MFNIAIALCVSVILLIVIYHQYQNFIKKEELKEQTMTEGELFEDWYEIQW